MWYFKEEDIDLTQELSKLYGDFAEAYYTYSECTENNWPWIGSSDWRALFSTDHIINNTKNKPMNFIQQAQLKKFTESTKVDQLTRAIEVAEENSALFAQVSARLADTALRLQDDVTLLNHYANHSDIASLQNLMEVVEGKIEAINTSGLSDITTELGEMFGIKKEAKLSEEEKKKEAMQSLGLV